MGGYNYCVNCGWELAKPYSDTSVSSDPVELVSDPVSKSSEPVEYESQPHITSTTSDAETYEKSESELEISPTERHVEDKKQSEEAQAPIVVRPTTAAGFTDLGIRLSEEGRHREAIDQFTKSIALDSKYALAWEKRAESYKILGLNDKSSQDLDHLKGLLSN